MAIGTKNIFVDQVLVNSKTMPEQKDVKMTFIMIVWNIEHFHYERPLCICIAMYAIDCVETETKSVMNQHRKLFDSRFSIERPMSTF